MPIQVLDQDTINQIAAGEVVERPASVVKELMENAIDAGATAVTAEIRDGGIGFIRITDNGCGIAKEELPLAFLRHSTSKIRTAADLVTVSSLGFRGEALSSIAAVSQVELITKTTESLTGSRYRIEGGKEKGLEDVGAPDGTTFISRNLFFNTPARRKFLKTAQTEAGHVADVVEKIALSHPEISIRLIVNGQNRLHTSGNHNSKDIVYTVYGREIAANLLPVLAENEILCIKGLIGKPVIARGNRNFENYFINGRYIKSGLIAKAIEDAYKSYMMQHKYPFTLLYLAIAPEYMDVNVHPSKMELRFKDGEGIYRLVFQAVSDALSGRELIPQMGIGKETAEPVRGREPEGKTGTVGERKPVRENQEDRMPDALAGRQDVRPQTAAAGSPGRQREAHPEPFEKKRLEAMGMLRENSAVYAEPGRETRPAGGSAPAKGPASSGKSLFAEESERLGGARPLEAYGPAHENGGSGEAGGIKKNETGDSDQLTMFDGRFLSESARYKHRLIGQIFDTYWLVEYGDTLYIIDQHAAHEKVLFERNFASLKSREYTSQMINPPIILTLSMQEAALLERHLNIFAEIGFEIEPFGGSDYAVRAVPDNLFSLAKKELLLELIDGISEDVSRAGSEAVYDRIASLSCKAAVKGNHRLSRQEADALIDKLLGLENPYTCPHGRPTIVAISQNEIEKKFKRIV